MPAHRTRPSPSGLASHGKSKGKFSTRPTPGPRTSAGPTAGTRTARVAAGTTGGKPAKAMTAPSSSTAGTAGAMGAGARPAPFPTKLSAAAGKRRRAAQDEEEEEDEDEEEMGSAAEGHDDDDEDGEVGTDEEIENAMERGRSSKTAKRKRRAVSPTSFGQALSAFLGEESDEGASSSLPSSAVPSTSTSSKAPSSSAKVSTAQPQAHSQSQNQTQAPIFSLAPSISSRISSTKLSEKAARVALEERRNREDQFRVRDLIGGWGRPGEKPGQSSLTRAGAGAGEDSDAEEGGEMDEWLREGGSKGFERRLRKVAQRGVVKLFNAIRAAQSTTTDDVEERTKGLSTASASASAAATGASAAVRPGNKNVLGGKSKELADLSKANFLDLIRSGGGGAAGKTAKA